jgi:stage II sporulation protein M
MRKILRKFWSNSLRYSWPAYLTIAIFFVLGAIAGNYGVKVLPVDKAQELNAYLDQFIQHTGLIEFDNTGVLWSVLSNHLILFAEIYLLGLTVIGIPVMLGIIFTRGFVFGYCASFLINNKGVQGLALAGAALLPQNILLLPALLIGGAASLSFALLLLKRFQNSQIIIWPSFLAYTSVMVAALLAAAVAGLVEVYLTPLLLKLAIAYLI